MSRIMLRDVHGPLTDLIEKLSGEEGDQWLKALGRTLCKEDPWSVKIWPIWRMLTVGGVSKEKLLEQLEEKGFYISSWARNIMEKQAFKTSTEPKEVSFVRVKVSDLGFSEMPVTSKLFDCSQLAKFNLDLCEVEDGPHLRLADANQPQGTWYWIAMEPITDSVGDPDVFDFERFNDGGPLLGAGCAYPDTHWHLGDEFVFRLRK